MQQKIKEPITESKTPFIKIPVSRQMLFIRGVGRLCACGCNELIIGRKHKRFASRKCKDHFRYDINGNRPNSKSVQAMVSINVNFDGTRNISLYFKRGVKKDIRISRNNCADLWDTLNQISEFRNRV